jgi:hypothetical protein
MNQNQSKRKNKTSCYYAIKLRVFIGNTNKQIATDKGLN